MAGAFKRLVGKLEKKGYSKRYASAVAATAGRKKLGAAKFNARAAAGRRRAAARRRAK